MKIHKTPFRTCTRKHKLVTLLLQKISNKNTSFSFYKEKYITTLQRSGQGHFHLIAHAQGQRSQHLPHMVSENVDSFVEHGG